MTKEWDDYRRGKVRAWLTDVSGVISKIRLVANQLKSESEAYDMLRGMAYDKAKIFYKNTIDKYSNSHDNAIY